MYPVKTFGQRSAGDSEEIRSTNQALHVAGLAGNAVLQTAGTYNATEVLGYRVVVAGSANWTLNFVGGGSASLSPSAFVEGAVYPEHLSSIVVGAGGSAVLYIP